MMTMMKDFEVEQLQVISYQSNSAQTECVAPYFVVPLHGVHGVCLHVCEAWMSPWCKRLVYHLSPVCAVRCDDSQSEQKVSETDSWCDCG